MPVIVSLDIETTGLDPKNDSVIEIGAVKFNENRVLDEFSTLVNPRKPINSFITNLTGITNAMVMNAPLLADIYPELETFIGDYPILGQNVGFDISFFQRYGGLKEKSGDRHLRDGSGSDAFGAALWLGLALLPTGGCA